MLAFDEKQFEQKVQTIFFDCFQTAFENYFPKSKAVKKEDGYISKKEAAKFLGCSVATIDNYRRKGIIKRHHIGSSVRFRKDELIAAVNQMSENKKSR